VTKRPGDTDIGYVIGAALMIAAGVVEVFLGVDAEQKSLEEVTAPLSAEGTEGSQARQASNGTDGTCAKALRNSPPRQASPYPVPRRRLGGTWAPRPQMSSYAPSDPYLADAIVAALVDGHSHSATELSRVVGARYWGPGRFREAIRSGLATGRARRVGRQRYAAGQRPTREASP
jgi:hypothetical protein